MLSGQTMGLLKCATISEGSYPAHPGWRRFVLPRVQLPCPARKIQGPCAGQNSFALLPLPAREDAENIGSIWASGDFGHLTNIICSITKQQYFGT